jgi:hypothetical protein
MPRYQLRHEHEARECPIVFAAWRGFSSPLRHRPTTGTCALGGHELWWEVDAADPDAALALLPAFIAARTRVVQIGEVNIP